MTPPSDREHLLDDVMAESAPTEFRAALLGETLRLARRRRIVRRVRRTGVALAAVMLAAVAAWKNFAPPGAAPRPVVAGCEIVLTRPLAAGAIVTTRAFGAERWVASVASVGVIRTARGAAEIHEINDHELLALAAPRLAALVRVGPQAQELLFIE